MDALYTKILSNAIRFVIFFLFFELVFYCSLCFCIYQLMTLIDEDIEKSTNMALMKKQKKPPI